MPALPPPTQPATTKRDTAWVEDVAFIAVLVSAVALGVAIVVLAFAL